MTAQSTRRFARNFGHFLLLGVILIFGAMLRLLAWHHDPVVSRDGVLYMRAAQNSVENEDALKHYTQGPLLLKAIQIAHRTGLSWEHAGVAVNVIAGTLLIVAVFWAAKELFPGNDWVALVSALLVASNPMLISLSYQIQRESLFLLFSTLAASVMFKAARESTPWAWAVSGIFTAVAASSRFEALELLLLAPVSVWLLGDDKPRWKGFLKIGYYLAAVVVGGLVLYCWFGLSPVRFIKSVWIRIGNAC